MKKIKTPFKGLLIYQNKRFDDKRGFLREVFHKYIIKKNLIFSVTSSSKKNVLRGLHLQTKKSQDKYITVLKGKILDVVVDLRKKSKTFGKHFKLILNEKNSKFLVIPKGFAHGFLCKSNKCTIYYKCNNYRDINSEKTIQWNDKNLKIKWEIKKPILSNKDKVGLTFNEFKKII